MIPLPRLLLETDAPYFPPRASSSVLPTFRQMKNPIAKYGTSCFDYFDAVHVSCRIDFAQPSHVLQVAAAVAKLKGVTLQQVHN